MIRAPLEGLKSVSAQEMARIEKMAYADGASEQTFMEKAGEGIALAVRDFIARYSLANTVTLLVGKGNNGGDAYAAGIRLLEMGFKVKALPLYSLDQCTSLSKAMHKQFSAGGGSFQQCSIEQGFPFEPEGVILDGLVGTGFKGQADAVLGAAMHAANCSGLPILAIDIPSGLNGTTGEVATVAIQATETLFLELPKSGFFLKEGWEHVGKLRCVTFGLGDQYIADAKAEAYLFHDGAIAEQFPQLKRARHKYQAGYVLAVAGSPGMPGAAMLSCKAALKSGAGIVRLLHPPGMQAELCCAPYELIREECRAKDVDLIQTKAAKVMLMGPGIGRTKAAKKMVLRVLSKIKLPMVIDADALFFLAEERSWALPKGSVLTPHLGEMQRLLGHFVEHTHCQAYAEKHQVTLVLKGAPTFIFHPATPALIIARGDPGMATAGAGDVLTGIIAALIAQGLEARSAAALGCYLHGVSGESAAESLTSYCMTASDLIDFLPKAFTLSK